MIPIRSKTKTNRGSKAHFPPRVSQKKVIEEQYGRVGIKARREKIIVRAAPTSRLSLLGRVVRKLVNVNPGLNVN